MAREAVGTHPIPGPKPMPPKTHGWEPQEPCLPCWGVGRWALGGKLGREGPSLTLCPSYRWSLLTLGSWCDPLTGVVPAVTWGPGL